MDRTFLAPAGSAALATRGATARISHTSNFPGHRDTEPRSRKDGGTERRRDGGTERRRDGKIAELNLMTLRSLRRSVAPSLCRSAALPLCRSAALSLCLRGSVTLRQSPNPKVAYFDVDFIFAPVARRGSVSRSDSKGVVEKRNRANTPRCVL